MIEVITPGRPTVEQSYFTDLDGNLRTADDAYVVVDVAADLPVGTKIVARLKSIDGRQSYCLENTDLFTVEVADRTWTKGWGAGASINAKGTIEFGFTATVGAGLSFKIDEVLGKGRDKLAFGRSTNVAAGIQQSIAETGGKFFIFGAGGQASASAGGSIVGVMNNSDEHEFKYAPRTDAAQPTGEARARRPHLVGGRRSQSDHQEDPARR